MSYGLGLVLSHQEKRALRFLFFPHSWTVLNFTIGNRFSGICLPAQKPWLWFLFDSSGGRIDDLLGEEVIPGENSSISLIGIKLRCLNKLLDFGGIFLAW